MSKGGRSYSDQSYGSIKQMQFGPNTIGTIAAGNLTTFVATEPITVTDWAINNLALGTGGAATFVLYKNSTTALGTIILAGTHAKDSAHAGSVTETSLTAGDTLDFYVGLATTSIGGVIARVKYRETFEVGNN